MTGWVQELLHLPSANTVVLRKPESLYIALDLRAEMNGEGSAGDSSLKKEHCQTIFPCLLIMFIKIKAGKVMMTGWARNKPAQPPRY